jgi:hypothetical protein
MPTHDHELSLALDYMRKAMALLDEVDAPAHIAAHVDLAAHQLQELVAALRSSEPQIRLANRQEGRGPPAC